MKKEMINSPPTHGEIIAWLEGRRCPACRRNKTAGVTFCVDDIQRLPMTLYRPLLANGGPDFDASYLAALEFLSRKKPPASRRARCA